MSNTNTNSVTKDEFDFSDLTPRQRLVKLPAYLGGKWYYLREASEAASVLYANTKMASARYEGGQLTRIEGGADVEPAVVEMCLYKTVNNKSEELLLNSNGQPVTIEKGIVATWPSTMVKPMFDWVRDNSRLDDADTVESLKGDIARLQKKLDAKLKEQEAKNPTPGGTVTSDSPTGQAAA